MFAGSAVSGSFYLFCEADLQNGVPCSLDGPSFLIQGSAGTSISAPAFAGIMALVVQNTNSRQGNINPVLYKLAARQPAADCNASGMPSSACILHDVTAGTIAMPCAQGSPNCVTANPRNQYGVLSGFDAGVEYDLATGLGSVDAFNLVTAAGWVDQRHIDSRDWRGRGFERSQLRTGSGGCPRQHRGVFGNFPLGSSRPAAGVSLPPMRARLALKFGDGFPVPLFFVSAAQVDFQVPWELAGQTQAPLTAVVGGQASGGQAIVLAAFGPGIFSMNGQGNGQGAILDASYRLVDASNPTRAGAVVQIYCTGLGAVTNQPASGATAPSDPLAETTTLPGITIGGAPAKVQFSGLTPGPVGLYQVNAEVPTAASRGVAVPVTIFIAGAISNTVMIAVERAFRTPGESVAQSGI
jgi:uncharacterized protein (TIGR03437 family)